MAAVMGEILTRSRSRSTDHNERLEPQLIRAAQSNDVEKLRSLIDAARVKGQFHDRHLSISLVESVGKGKISTTQYLLSEGASPNGAPGNRIPPLLRAVEQNYEGIVTILLAFGANPDIADKKGRTALMTAAWKNHFHVLERLLFKGADVKKKDKNQRNVLHNLGADKKLDWGDSIVKRLLDYNVPIDGKDGQDKDGRTPLHWACATGKKGLAETLLTRSNGPKANIEAVDIRQKTSLHIAASHGRDDMVELLLAHGANLHARSDGAWTPLHNACQVGSQKIVRILVDAGADINAKLLNGMTPLHIAAEEGHLAVVERLIRYKGLKRATRDSFGSTPFLRAAKAKQKDIVRLLAPFRNVASLSEDALGASKGFNATIVDFGNFRHGNKVSKKSLFELLYEEDAKNQRKPAMTIIPDETTTEFRWIHLPANNMAWVEALLTKLFLEEETRDVDGFKALERSFSHQHRGKRSHSHFMRPLCQVTPRAPRVPEVTQISAPEQPPPTIVLNGGTQAIGSNENGQPRTPSRTSTFSLEDHKSGSKSPPPSSKDKGALKDKSNKMHTKGNKSPKGEPKTSKEHQRKPNQHRNQNRSQRSLLSSHRKETSNIANGNIYTFLPYLHFETSQRCQEMKDAIKRAEWMKTSTSHHPIKARNHDEMLIRAHLASSSVSLHVRRTLDQSFYHNIDTQHRDQDQVVYRYQKDYAPSEGVGDPKIVMVDQMWMWVLGRDLVVTAFPQRWDQPRNDPLNVLDSIIEDINDQTRERIQTVYDLAITVTNRCTGVFDRHRMGDEDYQFLDMFESSIGNATDKETQLFEEFNEASRQASAWLRRHQRRSILSKAIRRPSQLNDGGNDAKIGEEHLDFERGPVFVDKLLDIGQETNLLAETKDIRDELNMMRKVLEDQQNVLPALEASICDIYGDERRAQQDVKKRFGMQLKMIEIHIKDIDRMDKQAERIYESVTDMLDLKQKHANAFEARFARDQATSTARQSQTIMVFTIVTIMFLPMSFIAAFFTINIQEFPHVGGGNNLPLSYVSKYMFGIGLSISIPLIFVAFYLDDIGELFKSSRDALARRKRSKQERKEFGDAVGDADDSSVIEVMKLEQVVSDVRKSVESGWVRDRLSVDRRRPGTAGSAQRERVMSTGFKDVSGDIEKGLRR